MTPTPNIDMFSSIGELAQAVSVNQTLEVLDYDKGKNLVILRWTETLDNPKG